MSYTIINNFASPNIYSIKCPYSMNPTSITIHNTANDASARAEVNYMLSNSNATSFHVAIDDKEAVQAIPFNRNAWHAGDGGSGMGNRTSIAIEICYSKSGGSRFDEAEKNAAIYVAGVLRQYGWGVDKVTTHQHWSGKYCPHRTLSNGWERFLNMVKAELTGSETPAPAKPKQVFWNMDAVLNVGDVVSSCGVGIARFPGTNSCIKYEKGGEFVNVPMLGGQISTQYVSESKQTGDGACDGYLANDKAKVFLDEAKVEKVDRVNDFVWVRGIKMRPYALCRKEYR